VLSFNPAATGTSSGSVSLTSSTSAAPIQIPLSGNGIVANHSVTFNWESNRSAAAGYNVYLRSNSDQTWSRLNSAPIPATSYTDWDVQPGRIYLFAVTSVNASNTESALSKATSATIPSP
jgi:fibronectin type 3 domain-containing protein